MDGVQGNGINSVHNGLLMRSDLRNDLTTIYLLSTQIRCEHFEGSMS